MPSNKKEAVRRSSATEDAVAFRTPFLVTEILLFPNGNTYPLCPRCNQRLGREYMKYCDWCGQRLGWKGFTSIRIRKWEDKTFI